MNWIRNIILVLAAAPLTAGAGSIELCRAEASWVEQGAQEWSDGYGPKGTEKQVRWLYGTIADSQIISEDRAVELAVDIWNFLESRGYEKPLPIYQREIIADVAYKHCLEQD